MKQRFFIGIALFLFSIAIANAQDFSDTYDVKFDNKYLNDVSFRMSDNHLIMYESSRRTTMHWLNQNQNKKVSFLLQCSTEPPTSWAYFEALEDFLNEKGKNTFLKGFKNTRDQQGQFKRIGIVSELEKHGVIAALNVWAKKVGELDIVELTFVKLPTYNFENETFTFIVPLANRKQCKHTVKVSTDQAAQIGGDSNAYLEAAYFKKDNPNPYRLELIANFEKFKKPGIIFTSFSIDDCD